MCEELTDAEWALSYKILCEKLTHRIVVLETAVEALGGWVLSENFDSPEAVTNAVNEMTHLIDTEIQLVPAS